MSKKDEIVAQIMDLKTSKVKMRALGNDNRSTKDFIIDVLHASGDSDKDIAKNAMLCTQTVSNLREEKTKRPQSETMDRIAKAYGFQATYSKVSIQPKFRNKPKPKPEVGEEDEL